MNPVKILFLAANPSDTAQLKTDEERRRIEAEILKSPHRDRIQLIYEPAIQPCSLIEAFRWHRPQIIHFSGHGSEANEIILVSDEGTSRLVGTDIIVELFRLQGKGVRVVLLNACYSRSQAEALTRYVDFAIGMSEAIPDPMALDFASAFYQGLAYGEPVRAAFDASLLQLRLAGLPRMKGTSRDLGAEAVEARGLIPELVERPGTDASRAILVGEVGNSPSTTLDSPGDGTTRGVAGLVGRLATRIPGGSLTLIGVSAVLGVVALVVLASKLGPSTGQGGNQAVATHPNNPPAYIRTGIDLNGRWTCGSTQSVVISVAFTSITIDMSAFNRPAAHGSIVDSTTITVTFPDSATYTGTLQPPNTIRWSNGTAWTKV